MYELTNVSTGETRLVSLAEAAPLPSIGVHEISSSRPGRIPNVHVNRPHPLGDQRKAQFLHEERAGDKHIERDVRDELGEELCMSKYVTVGGWSGRRKIPVSIIGETPDGFQVLVLERVFLPGHGMLKKGQVTIVPKGVIKVEFCHLPLPPA
jgi:hypothetical protein